MIRCKTCKRFTRNNVATVETFDGEPERIIDQRGDCSRCGPGVKLESEGWEDWFGWPESAA